MNNDHEYWSGLAILAGASGALKRVLQQFGGLLALFAAAALCGCSTAKACPDHPQSPCLTTGDIVVAVVVAVASILIVVTGVYGARREELSYYS